MKKPLLFLPTLIIGAAGSLATPTQAYTPLSQVWLTPQEVADYYNTKNNQRELTCLDDVDCQLSTYDQDINELEYAIGRSIFGDERFVISSIDRENNTAEVYFENNDVDVSLYNAFWRDSDARSLFIGWYDDDDSRIYELRESDFSTEEPGKHILYSENAEPGWLPSQTFVTLPIDPSINENTSDTIVFGLESAFFVTRDILDLSTCSAENPEWARCDLQISITSGARRYVASGTRTYAPSEPPVTDDPVNTDDPVTPDDPNNDEPNNDNPTNDEPTGEDPSNDDPTGDSPSNDEPNSDSDPDSPDEPISSQDEPAGNEPTGDEPSNGDAPNTTPTPPEENEPNNPSNQNDETVVKNTKTEENGAGNATSGTTTVAQTATSSATTPQVLLAGVHTRAEDFTTSTGNSSNQDQDTTNQSATNSLEIKESSIDVPLSSGLATTKSCGRIDFPWWFLIMILVGDIIAVWLFMPRRRQK